MSVSNFLYLLRTTVNRTRMWADAQRDGCPVEYTWHPLQKFSNSIPCTMPQFGRWPLLECPAVTLPV